MTPAYYLSLKIYVKSSVSYMTLAQVMQILSVIRKVLVIIINIHTLLDKTVYKLHLDISVLYGSDIILKKLNLMTSKLSFVVDLYKIQESVFAKNPS